jgi:hypothetical protein
VRETTKDRVARALEVGAPAAAVVVVVLLLARACGGGDAPSRAEPAETATATATAGPSPTPTQAPAVPAGIAPALTRDLSGDCSDPQFGLQRLSTLFWRINAGHTGAIAGFFDPEAASATVLAALAQYDWTFDGEPVAGTGTIAVDGAELGEPHAFVSFRWIAVREAAVLGGEGGIAIDCASGRIDRFLLDAGSVAPPPSLPTSGSLITPRAGLPTSGACTDPGLGEARVHALFAALNAEDAGAIGALFPSGDDWRFSAGLALAWDEARTVDQASGEPSEAIGRLAGRGYGLRQPVAGLALPAEGEGAIFSGIAYWSLDTAIDDTLQQGHATWTIDCATGLFASVALASWDTRLN